MPTTLSSGVALTHLAGGNSALALAVTVASNLLGILTIPFWVSRYIAGGVGVSFPTDQLFRSLIVTLLIPLIIGKVRPSFCFANFVDNNRKLFSRMNAICLSLHSMLFQSASSQVFQVIIIVRTPKEMALAVLLVASQKTLPVMVAVVEQLRGAFGEPGLLVLPCVAAHLNQIMIDSILVNVWLRKSNNASSTGVKTA
ncbi:unnamed protein product [Brassica napus]|nr:unnamed protein product [Brassica napus]